MRAPSHTGGHSPGPSSGWKTDRLRRQVVGVYYCQCHCGTQGTGCPDRGATKLGGMSDGNIEHRYTEDQAERSIERAVQSRKARAANALEETDQTKVTDRAGYQS